MNVLTELLPKLVSDDLAWLQKLKDEFHFSSQEAMYLKNELGGSYSDVYEFCRQDEFEGFDRIFAASVSEGEIFNSRKSWNQIPLISQNHLKGRCWLNVEMMEFLNISQNNANYSFEELMLMILGYLKEEDRAVQKVLDVLRRDRIAHESDALEDSLLMSQHENDENLNGLNYAQKIAVLELNAQGVTADQLRNQEWFNSTMHVHGLLHLITIQKYSPDQAVEILKNTPFYRVYGLYRGLDFKEVSKLNNAPQMDALCNCIEYGLKAEHIQHLEWLKTMWHVDALKYLLSIGVNIDLAIKKLEFTNVIQAKCIAAKLDHAKVKQLNTSQASALLILHEKGCRAEHLLGKKWFNCPYHKDVLIYLVRKLKFSIENAFAVINETSWLTILGIMKDLCRLDFSNLNHFHIIAILKLEKHGLKKNI